MAAYAAHAEALGSRDDEVFAFLSKSLAFLSSEDATDVGKLLGMVGSMFFFQALSMRWML